MARGYIGEQGRQIHYNISKAEHETGAAPLLLLPPAPHSGLYFQTVTPFLSLDRDVIAIDYPGYGGSDGLAGEPSIEAYVEALSPLLEICGQYDLVGFHTGALAAVEIGLQHGTKGKTILIDVPFLTPEHQYEMASAFDQSHDLPNDISDLQESFFLQVTHRPRVLPHARAVELWVETLRAEPNVNAAYMATFSYACADKFAQLDMPVFVVATASALNSATIDAANRLSQSTLIQLPQIENSTFENHASDMAQAINLLLQT